MLALRDLAQLCCEVNAAEVTEVAVQALAGRGGEDGRVGGAA